MYRWSLRCGWLLPLVVCLASVSCGSSGLNAVHGKVLYNGQPLSGALVRFLPENRTDANVDWPIGMTDAEGSFTLKTGEATGAPAGSYKVTIVCLETQEMGKQGMGMGGEEKDKLKGAYANPEKSSLSVDVKEGTNELPPFELK